MHTPAHVSILLDLWRTRRARSAAHAALLPFVTKERSRGGADHDVAWGRPYLLGFLGVTITELARSASPRLGTEGLGQVQIEVGSMLTGLPEQVLGERLLSLSQDGDREFANGCANAPAFLGALERLEAARWFSSEGDEAEEAERLWREFVSSRLDG